MNKLFYSVGKLFDRKRLHRILPRKFFIKVRWQRVMGSELDLSSPKTLNEKLQWLKLYDRNPLYPKIVDKCGVKEWISNTIGEEYVVPTIAVFESADEVSFADLPEEFVLKCTHDSGSTIVCTDKDSFDFHTVVRNLHKRLRYNYYWNARELPYKKLCRRIIVEPLLSDDRPYNKYGLADFKFFCFNGYVDCVMVCLDRATRFTKFYFYDKGWNLLKYNYMSASASSSDVVPKPACVEQMFAIAGELSRGIPFVRVDMYCVNDRPLVGEMTLYPSGGFDPNILKDVDEYLGSLIDLHIN